MRSTFYGYYTPTPAEYERLWREALIVLDTNVLLSVYRMPTTAREEFASLLESLQTRLWIPFHVGLEFQRNRLQVILQAREQAEAILKSSQDWIGKTRDRVRELELEKTGLEIDPAQLLADLDDASARLVSAVRLMHSSLVDASSDDPIRNRLDHLLDGRVGAGPATQEEIGALTADADARFDARIPPGYRDKVKDQDRQGDGFHFDGLNYQRKHGDLIIWRQLLEHAKAASVRSVLFVTSDQKEDWWWQERGRTMGPRPELMREIRRSADVELFWMYSAQGFADHAGRYTSTSVSETSVEEIESASKLSAGEISRERADDRRELLRPPTTKRFLWQAAEAEQIVANWIIRNGYSVSVSGGMTFPDLVIENDSAGLHGVEIKTVSGPGTVFRRLDETFARGYVEIEEGRLSGLTVVLVVVLEDFRQHSGTSTSPLDLAGQVSRAVERATARYSRLSLNVVLGTVSDGEFQMIESWGTPLV